MAVVPGRLRNVQKSVTRAELLFCQSKPIAFCPSRCLHRRRCLSIPCGDRLGGEKKRVEYFA